MSKKSTVPVTKQPQEAAPLLFAPEEIEVIDAVMAKRGEWTGERLRKEAPRLVEAVLKLSALDLTQEEIAFALGMSTNSVQRVQISQASAVEGYKERLSQSWREVTMLTLGAISEKLRDPVQRAKIKVGELGILAGIGTEKEQLLSGGATQRIEHTQAAPIEDFNAYIASLPQVEVLEMDPGRAEISKIGAGAGSDRALAAGDLGSGDSDPGDRNAQEDGVRDTGFGRSADMESAAHRGVTARDTGCATGEGCGTGADEGKEGGR